jgi:hypothetical protein
MSFNFYNLLLFVPKNPVLLHSENLMTELLIILVIDINESWVNFFNWKKHKEHDNIEANYTAYFYRFIFYLYIKHLLNANGKFKFSIKQIFIVLEM